MPKPFFFVPIEQPRHAAVQPGGLNGRLLITITAKTPLHFGAGALKLEDGHFVHQLSRENERVALPGSSFKGMLRSVFEAVSKSCMAANGGCKTCSACVLFGSFGGRGKLRFSPFYAEKGTQTEKPPRWIPQLYGPTTMPNERKFYRHSKAYDTVQSNARGHGCRGEYYECLAPGAVLRGSITYQNLTEDELGGLLFALGLGWGVPFFHKLGYAKPAYLGSVALLVAQDAAFHASALVPVKEVDLEKLASDYAQKHSRSGAVKVLGKEWTFLDWENDPPSDCDWREQEQNGKKVYSY